MTRNWVRMFKRGIVCCMLAGVVGAVLGCDPLTVHKVTTTIFDGVPSMPSAEQYCKDYHQEALVKERSATQKNKLLAEKGTESVHPPYEEKKCDNCHNKNTDSGFVVPLNDLCGVCHKNFLKGAYAHGPAAVGACLECHIPHNSPNTKLLKLPLDKICDRCHQEERLATALHNMVKGKGLICTNCHNPHAGNSPFFLE